MCRKEQGQELEFLFSLFQKLLCFLLQEDVHRSHRAHNTVDQIFKHALLLALTSTLITLTLSPSHSARGVLTTVTQPAQLWSVGTACTGRKRCVSISARMCLCVCLTSACSLWQVHPPPPSLILPKWVFCLHCL